MHIKDTEENRIARALLRGFDETDARAKLEAEDEPAPARPALVTNVSIFETVRFLIRNDPTVTRETVQSHFMPIEREKVGKEYDRQRAGADTAAPEVLH